MKRRQIEEEKLKLQYIKVLFTVCQLNKHPEEKYVEMWRELCRVKTCLQQSLIRVCKDSHEKHGREFQGRKRKKAKITAKGSVSFLYKLHTICEQGHILFSLI